MVEVEFGAFDDITMFDPERFDILSPLPDPIPSPAETFPEIDPGKTISGLIVIVSFPYMSTWLSNTLWLPLFLTVIEKLVAFPVCDRVADVMLMFALAVS